MDIVSGESHSLWCWVALMLGLTLLRLVFLSKKIQLSECWMAGASARIMAWFLHRLRILHPRNFHTASGEREVEAAYESTQTLQQNGGVFFQAVQAILQLAVFLPVLLYISWPLALFLFLIIVPVVAALQRSIHRLGPAEESLLRGRAEFRSDLNLARCLFRQWSAPAERHEISGDLLRRTRNLCEATQDTSIRKGRLSLVTESVSVVAMVCVLAFCALLMGRGWMQASDLVLFCSAVLLSYKPVKECARVLPQFRSVASALTVLEKFEGMETKATGPAFASGALPVTGFCVSNGNFSYDGSKVPVFSDMTMEWTREKPVLVRGRNGVGKSTLLRLLSGLELWNPCEKEKPIAHKSRVFFVAQSLVLPPRSYLKKMLDGGKHESCVPLADFAKKFNLFPLVEKTGLSGGELSRVSLLWALASDCDTILLDEPFASVALCDREPLLNAFLDVAAELDKWVVVVSHDVLSPEVESRFNIVNFDNGLAGGAN